MTGVGSDILASLKAQPAALVAVGYGRCDDP